MLHTYIVKAGALRVPLMATGAADAIARAIDLFGLHAASARRAA